jgi:subtilisin family serine protease
MRRLWFAVALIATTSLSVAYVPAVQAQEVAPEPIARALGTQTVGPVELGSATGGTVPWGLDRLDARSGKNGSYTYSTDGTGVKVYVADSGINMSHPEFTGRVLPGWSYRSDVTALSTYNSSLNYELTHPGEGIVACVNGPSHTTNPVLMDGVYSISDVGTTDNDGHGTHVAGTVGGTYSGVAKAVSLVPVRVLDSCGSGTATMVRKGLEWILANHQEGERAVVNMSIGFDVSATTIDTAIRNLMAEGIVVVAASGNSGKSACNTTPAGTPGTISVGAINASDAETVWSNYGDCVDIFAPGDSVVSAWPKTSSLANTFLAESGTSMAAPHVSGAVARYLQTTTVTTATPTDAWNWLKQNSTCNAVTYLATRQLPTRTPNRLLAVDAPAVAPCAPTAVAATVAAKSTVVSWTEPATANGSVITGYSATVSPGGQNCTTASLTCEITGLRNGETYAVTVTATNAVGISAPSIAIQVAPDGIPDVPVEALLVVSNRAVTISWPSVTSASSGALTYVVVASPGGATCSTQETSCRIDGLKNGTKYTFSVTTKTSSGQVGASSVVVTARPGFEVKKTTVKKKSRTLLSSVVTTVSKGKKTWSETGRCSLSNGRLVAPATVSTCYLTLKVAKSPNFPAMSTRVKVLVR